MPLIAPGPKSSMAGVEATILSLGWVSFVTPLARKTTASTPAMIHRVRFMPGPTT